MAVIPEAAVSTAGVTSAARAAAAADTVVPGDAVDLVVFNGSGASINVTIVAVTPCNQGVVHDLVVAVPAGATKIIGPIDARRFGNATTGLAAVNYSATPSVTVYTIRS